MFLNLFEGFLWIVLVFQCFRGSGRRELSGHRATGKPQRAAARWLRPWGLTSPPHNPLSAPFYSWDFFFPQNYYRDVELDWVDSLFLFMILFFTKWLDFDLFFLAIIFWNFVNIIIWWADYVLSSCGGKKKRMFVFERISTHIKGVGRSILKLGFLMWIRSSRMLE